jgi:hypothetical protein
MMKRLDSFLLLGAAVLVADLRTLGFGTIRQ